MRDIATRIDGADKLLQPPKVTKTTDVFSLGASIIELYYGSRLAEEKGCSNALEVLRNDADGVRRDEAFKTLGIDGTRPEHDLIKRMFSLDPSQRSSASEIAGSRVFNAPEVGTKETRDRMAQFLVEEKAS